MVAEKRSELVVADLMSTEMLTLGRNDTLNIADDLMKQKRVRHLPVVEDESLVGLISIGDVVKSLMSYQEQMIQQLEAYITGKI